jgi:hypothetical protein
MIKLTWIAPVLTLLDVTKAAGILEEKVDEIPALVT